MSLSQLLLKRQIKNHSLCECCGDIVSLIRLLAAENYLV